MKKEKGRGLAERGDFPSRLQAAVGDAYRIDKELGGGGMSRVFLAEEVRLGRKVVIKVLPPEMGAGVNVERFEREIQLAANLQHPHIVPLLTTGASGDLLYYVMPFIKGESLRAKLAREGELPVGEAVRILRDVADALAYAHSEGVVHRDIKPDNVLLSGNHAVVTDFGVAKAVSASTGESSLTSLGVALGTPAYMAPEQAVADPHVDHRADIYALGALAYEMLTGRPPFTGANAQAVLSAHVTEAPQPVTGHRDTVPPALNDIIMRCLAKKAADRWQRADDVRAQFEAMATPTGGITPTGTQPVQAVTAARAVAQAHPVRVAALFALASVGVLAIVYAAVQVIGLPDWVFWGAIGLLAVGLPIILLTGHRERQRAMATMTGVHVTTPVGLERHFTWRKALLGGGLAFAGLALVAAVYMGMRGFGIGPVGTLVASGVLKEREPILLAEFVNRTDDSTLGTTITEAFRVDLAQSPVVKLVDASAVADALRRMQRDAGATLDVALAREVAERAGVKALVVGEIGPAGKGYVLSATVMGAADGEVLTAVRETAADDGEIIQALDRLSGKLRERIGESLRNLRAKQPLEQVTTGSLVALRKYSQALHAEQEGEIGRALSLLGEAISLDSAFAMAYRKQAVMLSNTGAELSRVLDATRKAFRHLDRLPEIERYLTIARYYGYVEYDRDRVIAAYRSALDLNPDQTTSLNNLSVELNAIGHYQEAEQLALRAMTIGSFWYYASNAVQAQVAQGKWAEAQATIDRRAAEGPADSPFLLQMRAEFAAGKGEYDQSEREYRQLLAAQRDPAWQATATVSLLTLKEVQGQLGEAAAFARQNMDVETSRGVPGNALLTAVRLAAIDTRMRGMPDAARRRLQEALARFPLAGMSPTDRPYIPLAVAYADAGEPQRARGLLAEFEKTVPEPVRRGYLGLPSATGAIALAEQRYQDAIVAFRAWDAAGDGSCQGCALYRLGYAFELAGQTDSALATYERAVALPRLYKLYEAPTELVPTYKRLGELYEKTGDRTKAVEAYSKFVDLWKNADPELQAVVRDVTARRARLAGEGR